MRSMHEAVGRELQWRPRGVFFSRIHDLVDAFGEQPEPYATLTMRGGVVLFPHARCETADGIWIFRHQGFWRDSVLVEAEGAGTPMIRFRRQWRRGEAHFEDGREYVWRPSNLWGLEWRFEDANGSLVLRLWRRFSFPRPTVGLSLESSAGSSPAVTCLACLGYYLLLLARRRHAARAG